MVASSVLERRIKVVWIAKVTMNAAGMIQSTGETTTINVEIASMKVADTIETHRRGKRGNGKETFIAWGRRLDGR